MKKLFHIFLLLTLAYVILAVQDHFDEEAVNEASTSEEAYRITRIIDGDTFWAQYHQNQPIKIRLIGIDAPETQNTGKKKSHAYGPVATQALRNYLKDSVVYLAFDKTRKDRYSRTLAYVYNTQSQFVNYEMIRQGHATMLIFKPNHQFEELFQKAEDSARKERKGIWQQTME